MSDPVGEGREPVARLEEIRFAYGGLTVFEGVSLSIPANAVTAIVGPNGAGKSTLARILAGVLEPDAGSREVPTEPERPISFLPQAPQFRPAFTVEETLEFYDGLLAAEGDVPAIVDRVGLAPVVDRRVDALSGGMRRLLGIAVSLLGDPDLVVLDEPTSGLDPRMQRHLFDVVADVASDDRAVLLNTHNLVGAERADRVVLLDRGAIVADATPEAFCEETGTESLLEAFVERVPSESVVQAGVRGES